MNGGKYLKAISVKNTRQFIGIDGISDYSVDTPMGRLVLFIIQPTNIGVLPEESISARISALLSVLKSNSELEMLAVNSKESFEFNKSFYRQRIEKEKLPVLRRLLEQDIWQLDRIQFIMASAREFCLAVRLTEDRSADVFPYLARIEKNIRDNGFTVRRATRKDLKRMLALYFEQNTIAEDFENFDGERWGGEIIAQKEATAHKTNT